jgi:hypothetical protein
VAGVETILISRNTFRLKIAQSGKWASKTLEKAVWNSMTDWSLAGASILKKPRDKVEEEQEQGLNVANMCVIVNQSELLEHRTCLKPKENRQLTMADYAGSMPCGDSMCITCHTSDPQRQIFSGDCDVEGSSMLDF